MRNPRLAAANKNIEVMATQQTRSLRTSACFGPFPANASPGESEPAEYPHESGAINRRGHVKIHRTFVFIARARKEEHDRATTRRRSQEEMTRRLESPRGAIARCVWSPLTIRQHFRETVFSIRRGAGDIVMYFQRHSSCKYGGAHIN